MLISTISRSVDFGWKIVGKKEDIFH